MRHQDIRELFDYNYWANHLLLDRAENVSAEQFTAPAPHSFGSLQGTLVHTLHGERLWRLLLQGQDFWSELRAVDFPSVATVRQRWQEEEAAMWGYLDSLRDEDMLRIVRYEVGGGVQRERVLWHCLFHLVNHGTQHRSEAAAILTTCGQSPGDIDFTRFLNERKAQQG